LWPALKEGRVQLRLNALVSKIRFDDSKTAVGVEFDAGGDTHWVDARREVILCAGAYNSPHLLLLSGIGNSRELAAHRVSPVADVPGVGRSLQDHPCVGVKYRSARPGVSPGYNMNIAKMAWTGAQWLLGRTGLGATNLWETGTFFRSRADVDYVDIQHEFVPLLGEYGQGKMVVEEGFYYSTCLMRPKSRGVLELRSPDPATPPKIVNNYLEHPEDRRALVAAVKHTDEIIQQPGWDEIRGEPVSPPLRGMSNENVLAWLKANVSTQYHPCATCRMGVDDLSVVDAEGRVHGVRNLRVVDASIMPLITSGNLQSPTLMLAEKIADGIRGRAIGPQAAAYADQLPSARSNAAMRSSESQ
jgi:choline dehydrogenase